MHLDEAHVRYLTAHHQGRLATVASDGTPQVKPVGYRYNAELHTIDIAGFHMEASAKYRNIATTPQTAFVVDDAVGEGAAGMRFLEIRGPAEQAQVPASDPADGLNSHIIRIQPRRIVSWNVDPERPGLQTRTLADAGTARRPLPTRPTLGSHTSATHETMAAVSGLIDELQTGWDQHDADVTDRHVANDVVWGSPFGATVSGYDELHAIHARLKTQGMGGPSSRFEVVQVLAPIGGVVLAQVRRVALDDHGQPVGAAGDLDGSFSEMALYVLVRRGQQWWLAAGQNTPIRPKPAPAKA